MREGELVDKLFVKLIISKDPQKYSLYEQIKDELVTKYNLPEREAIRRAIDYVTDDTSA